MNFQTFYLFVNKITEKTIENILRLTHFFNFFQTEYLDLSQNSLKKVPESFRFYENLIALNLSYNKIVSIHRQVFNRMYKLNSLDLSNNHIKSLTDIAADSAFISNSKLQSLNLSGNTLSNLGEAYDQILYSGSLTLLDVSRCSITHVQGAIVFQGLPKLTHLNLSQNPITRLEGLISDSLISIDVSECNIQFLRPETFDGVNKLRELRMSNNKHMTDQHSKVASNSITYLDIAYCSVDSNYASHSPKVQTALLRGNRIQILPANAFQNNSELIYLDLSDNRIKYIDELSFYGTESLRELDLSGNFITSLAENTFTFSSFLYKLNLSSNSFSMFNLLKAPSIINLDLSICKINSISLRALDGLPSLQVLNMSHNTLESLPENLSSYSLQFLDLSYCRLTSINVFNFHRLKGLKEINLSGNRLVYIKNSTFVNNKLMTLTLSNNPWRCDCMDENFHSLWVYLMEADRVKNTSTLICLYPENITGQSWGTACSPEWTSSSRKPKDIIVLLIIAVVLITSGITACVVALREGCIKYENPQQDIEEMEQNRNVNVQQIYSENTSTIRESIRKFTQLPSYDEALLLPRPLSSSYECTETRTDRTEKSKKRQSATQTDESITTLLQEICIQDQNNQERETREEKQNENDIIYVNGTIKRSSWQEIEYINITPLEKQTTIFPSRKVSGLIQCTEL